MSRGSSLSVGLALVSAALSILLKKEFWAYLLLVIGLGFIILPELVGWFFGPIRPSFKETDAMPSAQYKPLIENARSRRWIKLVDWWNGYD